MLSVTELPGREMTGSHDGKVGRDRLFGLEVGEVHEDKSLTVTLINEEGEPTSTPFIVEDGGTTADYLEKNWLYPPIQLRYRLFNGELVEVEKVKK